MQTAVIMDPQLTTQTEHPLVEPSSPLLSVFVLLVISHSRQARKCEVSCQSCLVGVTTRFSFLSSVKTPTSSSSQASSEVEKAAQEVMRAGKGKEIVKVDTEGDPIVFSGVTHEEFVSFYSTCAFLP